MKCNNCGEEIANDSNYCEFCGARVIDEVESTLLNILEQASNDTKPFTAYKARQRCYKLCKKERSHDYKEYVNKILFDNYPALNERCENDIKYLKQSTVITVIFFISLKESLDSSHSFNTLIICILAVIAMVICLIRYLKTQKSL